MSSEFDPRPVETPSVQMPESLPRFEGGYEGRRRKMILEDSEQREVSLAFGDNALQTPERIDYTTEVDISGLDSETLGYLDEAQRRIDTWEGEVPDRAEVVKKIVSVASRRDDVMYSDRTKMRLFTEIMPLSQLERDQANADLEEQRIIRDHASTLLQQQHDVVDQHADDAKTSQGLINDADKHRKETKGIRELYYKRFRELALGHTEDGTAAEPLTEDERDQWIVDGMQFGPLGGVEADPNSQPGSTYEIERAKAVIEHIMGMYDAEIARINAYINEQRQLRDEANERKAKAEIEQHDRHQELLRQHLTYSSNEMVAEEAQGRYVEASKLPRRIIGKPQETFGEQVARELREAKDREALAEAVQQRIITFGSAGPRTEADRLAGRTPLRIPAARIVVSGVAARLKIRGISSTKEITVGYPKERE